MIRVGDIIASLGRGWGLRGGLPSAPRLIPCPRACIPLNTGPERTGRTKRPLRLARRRPRGGTARAPAEAPSGGGRARHFELPLPIVTGH